MADDDATARRVAARLAEVREGNRLASELGYPRDPRDVPALLAAVEKVLALAAKHEHGALRREDSLPVPGWIPELRAVIAAALLGEEATDG